MNNLYHKLSICVILGLFSQTVTGFFLAQQHPSTGDGENLLNGKIVRVASVEIPPFVEFVRDENGNIVEGKGFSFEILNALMEAISIEVPTDNAYGTQLANGSWSGMIAMILNNESDIGVGSFSVIHVRHQVIDFTVSYYEESSAIMIPAPTRAKQSSAFTKPFQFKVWVILIAILGLLPFIMWIQSKLLENARSSFTRTNRQQRFLFVYGVILTQSGQKIPGKEHSLRFLAIIWCLSAVIFIHAYLGTLMSFLSVPNIKPVLRSLEDLPSSGLKWIVWKGSDLESLFMEATDGINHIIGDGLRKNPNRLINSVVEGGRAVFNNGSFAYMHNKASIESMIEKDFLDSGKKCRASVAKETFYKVNQAFALSKGSPLGLFFNKKMLMMMESGLMEHWRIQHLSAKDHCSRSNFDGTALRRLTLDDFKSAFFILLVGLSIAFTVFISENVLYFVIKHSSMFLDGRGRLFNDGSSY